MTNKKLKHAQYNMQMQKVLINNLRYICECALVLNGMGVSRNKAVQIVYNHENKFVPVWNAKSEDVKLYDLEKELAYIGVTYRELITLAAGKVDLPAAVAANPQSKRWAIEALAENIALMCINVNETIGFGTVRLHRMLDGMRDYKGDAIEDAKEKLGLEFEGVDPTFIDDYRKYRTKRDKIDRSDARRIQKGMRGLAALQRKEA